MFPPIRIIFCGTPAFACPALRALHADPGFEILQVITQPDKRKGRGGKIAASPVKVLAESLGIPVGQPEDINSDQQSAISDQDIDFLVVVAYGQILSRDVLAHPRIAPVNLHASLLPRFRGASPIEQAILAAAKETGVTIQSMVEKLDAGPLLGQESVPIAPRETRTSLEAKLAEAGAVLLLQTLKEPLRETPQDETQATFCRKLTKEMGEVDPETMTAEEIDRRVRALVPWPGVRMRVRGKDVKLIETSLEPLEGSMQVPCADGTLLHLIRLQSPGRNAQAGREWKRGVR